LWINSNSSSAVGIPGAGFHVSAGRHRGYDPAMMELVWKWNCCRMASLRVAAVLVLAAMAASVAVAVGSQPEAVRMVQGASSGEHLWVVVPSDRDPQRWHLLHHAWEMDGPYYSPQPVGLSREPEAMAAYGERLWLIFPPRGEGPPQRGVFTVAVERDAALEIYRPTPRDRLQILEALPAAGRLTSFVATDRGPIALLVPRSGDDPRGRGVIEQPDSPPDPGADDAGDADFGTESAEPVAPDLAEAAARRPLLLQMRSKRWRELALPDDIVLTSAVRLAVAGYDRSELVVLSVDPSDSARTLLHRMSFDQDAADEQVIWDRSSLELDLNRVLAVETVRGRLVAVVQDESRQQPHLRYIRPTQILELGEMPDPRGRWNVFGMADVMRMIEYSTRDGAMMRRINPVTGEATKPELMRVQPLPAGRMWYTSLLLAAAVVAVLLVLLVRPGRQDKVNLPKVWASCRRSRGFSRWSWICSPAAW
jgi:hypothetical protein